MPTKVTDPSLLAQLNGPSSPQKVTDPAILAQLNGVTTSDTPPQGAVPGSKAYADWAVSRARLGQPVPAVSQPVPQNTGLTPASAAIPATMQGITGAIPGLNQAADALIAGGQSVGDMFSGKPVDFGAHYNAIQDRRQQFAQAAPIAQNLGGIGGTIGLTAGLGAIPAGAEAMGMTGNFGRQLGNSLLSTAGYEGLQGLAHGHLGAKLLADEGIGAASGAGGSILGQTIGGIGSAIANKLTKNEQNSLIDSAISQSGENVTAADVKGAGAKLFDEAFPDGKIPMVTDTAYMKFMSGVQQALKKIRPNEKNDPQSVGLLDHLMSLADTANTSGSAVDLQDLHLARQLAGKVAQSNSGRDQAVGSIVTKKIDDLVEGLKNDPSSVLGGQDASANAEAFQQAIPTWYKAKKMGILENAMEAAQGYSSGLESGLKRAFTKLRGSDDFARFSPAEQAAIKQVAEGTAGQNIASIFGRLGYNIEGAYGSHNILGGSIGNAGVTGLIAPFMGPLAPAAPFAAMAITTPAGMLGRKLATDTAKESANRAIQAVARGGIQSAKVRPNLLANAVQPVSLGLRALGTQL